MPLRLTAVSNILSLNRTRTWTSATPVKCAVENLNHPGNWELVVMWVDHVLVDDGYISVYGVDTQNLII